MPKQSGNHRLLALFLMLMSPCTAVVSAGADTSWVPLQDVAATTVHVNASAVELSGVREELLGIARATLEKRQLHATDIGLTGLVVDVDVIDTGDDCAGKVVLVTTVRFVDWVVVNPDSGQEPIHYHADTWKHTDMTVVDRSKLSIVARQEVTDGVTRFAESLSKARAMVHDRG